MEEVPASYTEPKQIEKCDCPFCADDKYPTVSAERKAKACKPPPCMCCPRVRAMYTISMDCRLPEVLRSVRPGMEWVCPTIPMETTTTFKESYKKPTMKEFLDSHVESLKAKPATVVFHDGEPMSDKTTFKESYIDPMLIWEETYEKVEGTCKCKPKCQQTPSEQKIDTSIYPDDQMYVVNSSGYLVCRETDENWCPCPREPIVCKPPCECKPVCKQSKNAAETCVCHHDSQINKKEHEQTTEPKTNVASTCICISKSDPIESIKVIDVCSSKTTLRERTTERKTIKSIHCTSSNASIKSVSTKKLQDTNPCRRKPLGSENITNQNIDTSCRRPVQPPICCGYKIK